MPEDGGYDSEEEERLSQQMFFDDLKLLRDVVVNSIHDCTHQNNKLQETFSAERISLLE